MVLKSFLNSGGFRVNSEDPGLVSHMGHQGRKAETIPLVPRAPRPERKLTLLLGPTLTACDPCWQATAGDFLVPGLNP